MTKITTTQSQSEKWLYHRAGRITASKCKPCYVMNLANPAISTISSVLQYQSPIKTKDTEYGNKHEQIALKKYVLVNKEEHTDFAVTTTGLHIHQQHPFLGASPDGIVQCSCHERRLIEIKCPAKYKKELKNWRTDVNCPITKEGVMNQKHQYYHQIQLQLLVTNYNICDFFVWSSTEVFQLQIVKDISFCKQLEEKLSEVFHKVILPELVSRRSDPNNKKEHKLYCICQKISFPPMIGCDNTNCKYQWFHYSCVNIKRTPAENKKWFCPNCITTMKLKSKKMSNK